MAAPPGAYTIEELQQAYAISLARAADIISRFGDDRRSIDKMMKRCDRLADEKKRERS